MVDLSKYKNEFPDYLSPLFSLHLTKEQLIHFLIQLVIFLPIGYILAKVYFWYQRLQKRTQVDYVFLEIVPTDRTLKSPLSTNQLFTMLHSLEDHANDGFLKVKRSMSLELVSTKEEGIRFILRVPKKDQSIVYKNLIAYLPGIEINIVDDYLALKLLGLTTPNHLGVKEMQLKNSYLLPLKDQEVLNQFDPIAFFTAHMTKMQDDELMGIQFICTPVHPATHSGVVKIVKETQKKLQNDKDISDLMKKASPLNILDMIIDALGFVASWTMYILMSLLNHVLSYFISSNNKNSLDWLIQKPGKKSIHELGLNQQQQFQRVEGKVNQSLFETTIRYFVFSKNSDGIEQRLRGIKSAFKPFEIQDQLLKQTTPLFSLIQTNFTNSLLQYELKHRVSLFGKNPVLSVSELSSMYHLPYTLTTKTEDLLQNKSPGLPAPLALKQSATELDIVFAKNNFGDSETLIGQTLDQRRRHTYIVGGTGMGKSTLMLHMIYQDMANGHGLAVLDPHGLLVEKVLGTIPQHRRKDVIVFDPYDTDHPLGLNLLHLPKGLSKTELAREKDFICSNIIAIFHKLYAERYMGPRMEHVLQNAILTILETENPTFGTLYKLLTNTRFRKKITAHLEDEFLKGFWKTEFENLTVRARNEMVSPITNKLGKFLTLNMTRQIIEKAKVQLNIEEIMNDKKILICDLAEGKIGEDTTSFLGGLLIAKIQQAALRRIHIPEDDRVDFFLYIDEFQSFATSAFAKIFSEARKYRLGAILVHQYTAQIDNDLLEAILGNAGTFIAFRGSSPTDEEKLQPIFAPHVEKGQLSNLPSFGFYIKIHATVPQNAFTGMVEKFPVLPDKKIAEEVKELSRRKYSLKEVVQRYKRATKTSKRVVKATEQESFFAEVTDEASI